MNKVKPDSSPWIVPHLTVVDGDKAAAFYQNAFGFQLAEDPLKDEHGHIIHASIAHKAGVFLIGVEGHFDNPAKAPVTYGQPSPMSLYVYCDNVDQLLQRATEYGAEVIKGLEDMFWGDRVCKLLDPDQYTWMFATQMAQQ